MKSNVALLILLVLSILSWNCSQKNNPVTPNPTNPVHNTVHNGRFGVTYLNGLAKISKTSSDSVNFDLGDLRGSKSFYFILQNTGDTSITNISLTSTDTSLVITPSHIAVLNTNGTSSVLQTVKVTILDGTLIENGIGSVPLQPMGDLMKSIQIVGSSNSTVSLNLNLTMHSYVMDITMFSGLDTVNFSSADPNIFSSVPFYNVPKVDSIWSIQNIGNVPIKVTVYTQNFDSLISKQTLNPNQTMTFPIIINAMGVSDNITIEDYTNTIYNSKKFYPNKAGLLYFQVYRIQ